MNQAATRDTLIRTASTLFRQKGYSGVGLSEILTAAELPKGSLYYHFPGGKRELADAATRWAGERIEAMLEDELAQATDFNAGAIALCDALAKAVTRKNTVSACPVFSILQAAPSEPALRETVHAVYGSWTDCLCRHAARLNHPAPARAASLLHQRLQGAWILAYSAQSDAPFRDLAEDLRGG